MVARSATIVFRKLRLSSSARRVFVFVTVLTVRHTGGPICGRRPKVKADSLVIGVCRVYINVVKVLSEAHFLVEATLFVVCIYSNDGGLCN